MYTISNWYCNSNPKYNFDNIGADDIEEILILGNIKAFIYLDTEYDIRIEINKLLEELIPSQTISKRMLKYLVKSKFIHPDHIWCLDISKGYKLLDVKNTYIPMNHIKNIMVKVYKKNTNKTMELYKKIADILDEISKRKCKYDGSKYSYYDYYNNYIYIDYIDLLNIKIKKLKGVMKNNLALIAVIYIKNFNKILEKNKTKMLKIMSKNIEYQYLFSKVAVSLNNFKYIKYAIKNKLKIDNICLQYAIKNNNLEIYDYLKDNGYTSNNKKISEYFARINNLDCLKKCKNISNKCLEISLKNNTSEISEFLFNDNKNISDDCLEISLKYKRDKESKHIINLIYNNEMKMTYTIFITMLKHNIPFTTFCNYKIHINDLIKIIKYNKYDSKELFKYLSEENKKYILDHMIDKKQLKMFEMVLF